MQERELDYYMPFPNDGGPPGSENVVSAVPYRKDILIRIANNWRPKPNDRFPGSVRIGIARGGKVLEVTILAGTGDDALDIELQEGIKAIMLSSAEYLANTIPSQKIF